MKKHIISALFISAVIISTPFAHAQEATSTTATTSPALIDVLVTPEPVIIAPLTGTTTSIDIEPGQIIATSTVGGKVEVKPTTTPTYPTGDLNNGDPINKNVEEVLNTKKPVPAKKATTSIATTTKTATTTAAGSVSMIDGSSNGFTPSEYYFPLDNLSAQTTYALSFAAMILGIVGAVLILKEPASAPVWMRGGLKTRESLLD